MPIEGHFRFSFNSNQITLASRYWVFTINNPLQHLVLSDGVQFCVYQYERGDSGTEHFQGYIEFKDKCRRPTASRELGDVAWCATRRGTQLEAICYATKVGRLAGPWKFGAPTAEGQGGRTDYNDVAQRVYDGATFQEIAQEAPGLFGRTYKFLCNIVLFRQSPVWRIVRCIWLVGPSGSGKTSTPSDAFGHAQVYSLASATATWFDGYSAQRCLLLDEYSRQIERKMELNIMDGHPQLLPIKCGHTPALWDTVVATSNFIDIGSFAPELLRRFATGGFFRLEGQRGDADRQQLIKFIRGDADYDRPTIERLRIRRGGVNVCSTSASNGQSYSSNVHFGGGLAPRANAGW